MLVLVNLFYGTYVNTGLVIEETSFLEVDTHTFINRNTSTFFNHIYISVYNTETKATENRVKLADYSKIEQVFGVVVQNEKTYFKVITDKLWKFMDICDGIQKAEYDSLVCKIRHYIPNENRVFEIDGVYAYCNYDYCCLDKYNIFWLKDDKCLTVLDVYLDVFEKLNWDVKEDTVIYFFFMNWFYKLDINDKVIRFITKLRTLGC